MNDIVREFLVESHENLAQLDLDLVTLEKEPGERETLARVFRTVHIVKGTAGFLGLVKLQAVSHAGESLLSRLRAGEVAFSAKIATALLGVVDAIRKMLAALEIDETEGDGDYSELIQTLDRLTPANGPRSRVLGGGNAARSGRDRGRGAPGRHAAAVGERQARHPAGRGQRHAER